MRIFRRATEADVDIRLACRHYRLAKCQNYFTHYLFGHIQSTIGHRSSATRRKVCSQLYCKDLSAVTNPKLSNIPLWNLREEFYVLSEVIGSEQFAEDLKNRGPKRVRTPLFEWYGEPDDLVTLLTQRAVLGLEAYVSGAVWHELGMAGRLTSASNALVRNPFRIAAQAGTVKSFYHHLPSLLSPSLSLQAWHPRLWKSIEEFYKEVRNPLFHGMQIQNATPENLLDSYGLIYQVYAWIDSWHKSDYIPGQRIQVVFRPNKFAAAKE